MAMTVEELTNENEILAEKLGGQAEECTTHLTAVKDSMAKLQRDVERDGADALSKLDELGPLLDQLESVLGATYDEAMESIAQGVSSVNRNRDTLHALFKGVDDAMLETAKKADAEGEKFGNELDASEDRLQGLGDALGKKADEAKDSLEDDLDGATETLGEEVAEIDEVCETLVDSRQNSFENTFKELVEPYADQILNDEFKNELTALQDEVADMPTFDVEPHKEKLQTPTTDMSAALEARREDVRSRMQTLATDAVGAVDGPLEALQGTIDGVEPIVEQLAEYEEQFTGFVEDLIEL